MKSIAIALYCAAIVPVIGAEPLVLKSGPLEVRMDRGYPRVIGYQMSGAVLCGSAIGANQVELNGKAAECRITTAVRDAASVAYTLDFPAERIAVEIIASVAEGRFELKTGRIAEKGTVKLRTLAFPNNPVLSIRSDSPDAAVAVCHATNTNDQFGATFRERIAPLSELKAGDRDTGNYLFLSVGPLAAGLGSNNFTDVNRCAWQVSETGGVKVFSAQTPVWEYRKYDDEALPAELPWVRVFVTPDLNGDSRADWQDAAIAFRRGMPKPFGHETVRELVGENIAMNFASGAQQPFLKILDEIKKIELATDGLPNQILIKGFSSEGHDSANTDYSGHWNERAGGLKDLNFLLENAGKHNARIGIHINATEAYPEAHRYQPEILRRNAQGSLVGGWAWLDHANMLDKDKDVRSGRLFGALDAMRRDLPKLDCVYVDTYWENGWPASQIARRINSLGLPMYSEGDCCVDPWIVWGHWRGTKHTIQRFLWFSDRDLFANDPILRGGRADTDGFMGWQNQHSFHNFISRTFSARLPAKFLQHFELLKWKPGESAEFGGGVKVGKSGNDVSVSQDGRLLMTWTGDGGNSNLFVPWPPEKPEKIYIWSDNGGDITRDLPPGWPAEGLALYQPSDRGRGGKTVVDAKDGKVTVKIPAKTAFVLYPKEAPARPQMVWGEGGHLVNPGFDSYDLAGWKGGENARVEADKNGNPRLIVSGAKSGISQGLSGIKEGKTYAATVWAQAIGGGAPSLGVRSDDQVRFVSSNLFNIRHSAPNDSRTGTFYQRLRVVFTAGASNAIELIGDPAGGSVEFDDVRVVETSVSPEAAKHTFWEDFEHIETGGYGPFTCCPGERTHLSECNPPHTRDTINGRFSLKSRDNGCVARTLTSSLPLKPATRYRISCLTLGQGRLTAISKGRTVLELKFPNLPDNKAGGISGEFVTRDDRGSYLALFRDGGDAIVIDDLAVDELRPATAAELAAATQAAAGPSIPDEKPTDRRILLEERFDKPLGAEWKLIPSKLPGTSITAADGSLALNAYAHISILAERSLPAGTTAVETLLATDGDQGETWGPGMALVWSGGQQLRINLRSPGGKFGIDSTAAPQKITGDLRGGAAVLRLVLSDSEIRAEARCPGDAKWQSLATFGRDRFPGDPAKVRLGKTHAVEALDDHSDIGPVGTTTYSRLRVYGK